MWVKIIKLAENLGLPIWCIKFKWVKTLNRQRDDLAYLDIHVGHEDGKVGEVGARARGVRPVGAEQAAVLRGPEARHASLGVAPKWAIGVEVFFRLLLRGKISYQLRCGLEHKLSNGRKYVYAYEIHIHCDVNRRWFYRHTASSGTVLVFHRVFWPFSSTFTVWQ